MNNFNISVCFSSFFDGSKENFIGLNLICVEFVDCAKFLCLGFFFVFKLFMSFADQIQYVIYESFMMELLFSLFKLTAAKRLFSIAP